MNRNIIHAALAAMLAPISELGQKFSRELIKDSVPWVTYSYQGGVRGNNTSSGPTYSTAPFTVAEIKLDFAAIALDRAAAVVAALGAADVLELFGVKAGTWVPAAALQTVTVEGAAATFDLGDGATPAGFISNHDGNAVGWSTSLITTTYSLATAGGKLYTADDTVDMVVDSANVDVALLYAFVAMVDLRKTR